MELVWSQNSDPFSTAFDDIYYAEEGGLLESRYVFLEQNRLEQRFQEAKTFVIAELGFGTGLNFFATWDLWTKTPKPEGAELHYLSCEKFPLSADQISKALERWPELDSLRAEFLELYSDLPLGFHRLRFEKHGLILTLLIGDALQSLRNLEAHVDAWYLDGFSPRKNPEMWSEEITQEIFRHSHLGTSFATYTSAGFIRRNLETAGFQVEKFKGFGRKRDMLRGVFKKEGERRNRIKPRTAIVIGGGIAGATAASALAKRGLSVRLIEKKNGIASAASQNPGAITLPLFSLNPSVLSRFSWSGFKFLKNFTLSKPKGLLRLVLDESKKEKWLKSMTNLQIPRSSARLVDANEASELAGMEIQNEAIYFEEALCVDLKEFCEREIQDGVEVISNFEVEDIFRDEGVWKVKGSDTFCADIIVLASAYEMRNFSPANWLPLRKVRGQLAYLRPNSTLQKLKTILCFDGFLTPALENGTHILGATYDNLDYSPEVREKENLELLTKLKAHLPFLARENLEIDSNWVEFRTNVAGQEPVVGEMTDRSGEILEGLYCSTAFSSRGSIYAPLAAELLASEICGEPLPVETDLRNALSPQRFTENF